MLPSEPLLQDPIRRKEGRRLQQELAETLAKVEDLPG